MTQTSINPRIEIVLAKVCIPRHMKGFDYLVMAIQCCLENPSLLHCMNQRLYPMLASIFGITASGIDASIRNAIRKIQEPFEKQSAIFSDEARKILAGLEGFTNNYFIAHITEYLRTQTMICEQA